MFISFYTLSIQIKNDSVEYNSVDYKSPKLCKLAYHILIMPVVGINDMIPQF